MFEPKTNVMVLAFSFVFSTEELEGKVTVIRNYQQLKDIQKNLVWPSVADLDPKSYVPEVCEMT